MGTIGPTSVPVGRRTWKTGIYIERHEWDVSAEESRAHHGLVAIGFAVLAVLVIAFCIWTFGGRGGAAWEFEADDALPIMTVKVTGGNTVGRAGRLLVSARRVCAAAVERRVYSGRRNRTRDV